MNKYTDVTAKNLIEMLSIITSVMPNLLAKLVERLALSIASSMTGRRISLGAE